jgi:hypothetical protein
MDQGPDPPSGTGLARGARTLGRVDRLGRTGSPFGDRVIYMQPQFAIVRAS